MLYYIVVHSEVKRLLLKLKQKGINTATSTSPRIPGHKSLVFSNLVFIIYFDEMIQDVEETEEAEVGLATIV